jgi:hypothetical protein
MSKVGFTGTQRGMTGNQSVSVMNLLRMFGGTEFHHGGCVGADVQAAELARLAGYRTIRHPGDTPSKQDHRFLDDDYRMVLPNLARNHIIVDEVNLMIAAPGEMDEVLRSGTWATIRYSRKLQREIYLVYPNGKIGSA